ncbi:fungal-specific transcription factor domain-containing protein [Exophiala viscosa]|uniref:Fungal-specific transcription factor domain-containing protein n=1 Tax=Exophiala viscosa TaxID=2486360 RepID=A0AAN6DTX8_9EURO|nr:fungal-specific transcription factor domain-containing protein [Exophiala viscosa]
MPQEPGTNAWEAASASTSEKHATPVPARVSAAASSSTSKLRSCTVCRQRKVKCDKQTPCSNCRRAGIACVIPSTDRPPRWARRLQRLTDNASTPNAQASHGADPGVDRLMERLRSLEDLVKELRGQLEQANAAASSTGSGPSAANSPEYPTKNPDAEHQEDATDIPATSNLHNRFGRLVLQDASRAHYISSGFWSRVDDELNVLKLDAHTLAEDEFDSSEEEEASSRMASYASEFEQRPWDRHAFLFRHNLSATPSSLHDLHPLPSQIAFLLDVYSENVNVFFGIIHVPTVTQLVRQLRSSGLTSLTPSNEALMFSIYFAAMTSMEEDDAMINFGCSRADLSLRYRLGLEHGLAKADFLNAPDIILVQALAIFICLARRHDSPRYVWMMTGLVIRMAQYLGLHRDGAHFGHLTPFEIHMRRRVWWSLCMLDLRTSEDQGTDLAIAQGSFDTKIPSNINDADINPETTSMPPERHGVTDMSFARISAGVTALMRQMIDPGARQGVAGLEDQNRRLNEIYQKFEQEYLQHATESGNIAYWVASTVARMVMGKMTLIVFLPGLFSISYEQVPLDICTRLLISAIEVAEYNHALNAEQACRHWRWLYQVHTHWHAIVFLLIEVGRRPWLPTIERAWVALHSSWLMPSHAPKDKNPRIWVPLRRLMNKARMHRDAELNRLRADPRAAALLETEDQKLPVPASPGAIPNGASSDFFRDRWRQLVQTPGSGTQLSGVSTGEGIKPSMHTAYTSLPATGIIPTSMEGTAASNVTFGPTYSSTSDDQTGQVSGAGDTSGLGTRVGTGPAPPLSMGNTADTTYNTLPTISADWSDVGTMGAGLAPWLWVDIEPMVDSNRDPMDANVDVASDVNWYEWVQSARGME